MHSIPVIVLPLQYTPASASLLQDAKVNRQLASEVSFPKQLT